MLAICSCDCHKCKCRDCNDYVNCITSKNRTGNTQVILSMAMCTCMDTYTSIRIYVQVLLNSVVKTLKSALLILVCSMQTLTEERSSLGHKPILIVDN